MNSKTDSTLAHQTKLTFPYFLRTDKFSPSLLSPSLSLSPLPTTKSNRRGLKKQSAVPSHFKVFQHAWACIQHENTTLSLSLWKQGTRGLQKQFHLTSKYSSMPESGSSMNQRVCQPFITLVYFSSWPSILGLVTLQQDLRHYHSCSVNVGTDSLTP